MCICAISVSLQQHAPYIEVEIKQAPGVSMQYENLTDLWYYAAIYTYFQVYNIMQNICKCIQLCAWFKGEMCYLNRQEVQLL